MRVPQVFTLNSNFPFYLNNQIEPHESFTRRSNLLPLQISLYLPVLFVQWRIWSAYLGNYLAWQNPLQGYFWQVGAAISQERLIFYFPQRCGITFMVCLIQKTHLFFLLGVCLPHLPLPISTLVGNLLCNDFLSDLQFKKLKKPGPRMPRCN